jgi:hypothetical protein
LGFFFKFLEQELGRMEAAAHPETQTRIGRLSQLFELFDNDRSGVVRG